MDLTGRQNKRVCFIGGAGHSGSTLLGLVLGSHSNAFYAGEAAKTRYLDNLKKDARKRVCKLCGPSCEVWGDFTVEEEPDLYEQISRRVRAPTIIDSTKNLKWISEHVKRLELTDSQPCFIFLQRDGRAVVNSRIRKYPDRDPLEQIDRWISQIQKTMGFYDSFPHLKTTLRYEDFATRPKEMTALLCKFLELEFEPQMLNFYHHQHHPLGGNNGTQFLVARYQGPNPERPYAQVSARSRDYYKKHISGIKLDLRWVDELPKRVLAEFESRAGKLNEPMLWETDKR